MKARTASRLRVFSTCRASTPPRAAVPTPMRIWRPNRSAKWPSLSITTVATRFDGLARQMAVEIEVAGRAVHLDGRAGVACRHEEAIPVEVVAVGPSRRPVGGVGDDADQGMRHRAQVAREQPIGRLAGGVVERREHDVETGHDGIRQIQAAVGQDVDLAAVQDRQLGIGRPERLDLARLLGDAARSTASGSPSTSASDR